MSFPSWLGFDTRTEGPVQAIPAYGFLCIRGGVSPNFVFTEWTKITVNNQYYQVPKEFEKMGNTLQLFVSKYPGVALSVAIVDDLGKTQNYVTI